MSIRIAAGSIAVLFSLGLLSAAYIPAPWDDLARASRGKRATRS